MKSTETKKPTEAKKPTTKSLEDIIQLELITKEYASILVNQMLSNDGVDSTVLSARSRLQFYDDRLRKMGLRATIKVGTEKIA